MQGAPQTNGCDCRPAGDADCQFRLKATKDARVLRPSADRARPWRAREGGHSPFSTTIYLIKKMSKSGIRSLSDPVPHFVRLSTKPFDKVTWREGRCTGAGNHVLTGGYRVFLTGDRQTKCLCVDRQRTVCCPSSYNYISFHMCMSPQKRWQRSL